MPDPSGTVEAVYRVKQKIDSLTAQQAEFLQRPIYVGMTPAEAKVYDEKRQLITELIQQLATLEKAQ